MKYQAKISGKKQEWTEATPEMLQEWSFEKRPGGWIIASRIMNGVQERVRFFYARSKQKFWAKIQDRQTQGKNAVDFYGERIPLARAGSKNDSASDFTAQFPGKVRKILVQEGQRVEVNTPLLMIEAMKMEFAVKATNPGVVNKILVMEGQVLAPGAKLLDFTDDLAVANEVPKK